MNLIDLSSFKRARVILWINTIVLFVLIILTPHFIKIGFWGLSKEWVVSCFLTVEFIILIKLFREYDIQSRRNEKRIDKLGNELAEKHKTLLDSLEYVGKINIQMSIIAKIMNKLRFPHSKNKLDKVILEMLQALSTLSGGRNVILRIINLKTNRTIEQFCLKDTKKYKQEIQHISNKILLKEKYQNHNVISLPSNNDNFSLKAVAIFIDNKHKQTLQNEQESLMQGIVNQCEIIFLLFNSKYYSSLEK